MTSAKSLPSRQLAGRIAPAVLAVALAAAGCGPSSPGFRLNTDGRRSAEITQVQQQAIAAALQKLFGETGDPKLPNGVDLKLALLQQAAGPVRIDAAGNQLGLYRQHCSTCHGLTGDGAGSTAGVQNPYPRDFRQGWFKYTSTAGGAKPIGEDLERILQQGVAATAMPAFDGLAEDEVLALVEYVKYLSIRGETELYLLQLVIDEDAYLPLDMDEVIEDGVLPAAESWTAANQMKVHPAAGPEDPSQRLLASIGRGRELFLSKEAQCVQCHGRRGNGRGEQSELYDDWNKPKKGSTPQQTRRQARLFRLPIQRLRPRDFTRGVFRGGSRPEDICLRIHVGIKGTPMPAGGPAPGTAGALKPGQISDVANYVRSLSR